MSNKHKIENSYLDCKLKNLINLSANTELILFNKNLKLKSKNKLLKDCDVIKKKELKKSSHLLSNLAKLNNNNITGIDNICNTLHHNISNIDNIINYINDLDTNDSNENPFKYKTIKIENIKMENASNTSNDDTFIECFSNC